ncbi:MAG: response regulator transcription factor [Janthinobacterium lividum]
MISAPNLRQNQLENDCKAQFFSVDHQLKKGLFTIQDIGDYIPGNLMVHDISTNTNIYMNKSGCNILKHSREELQALGPEYFNRFFPKEEIKFLNQGLEQFINQNDHTAVHSFLQRVRPNDQVDYKWYFTSSKLCCLEDTTNTSRIMHLAVEANTLNNLGNKLNRIFEENIFITQNYRKFNLLTKREKELIKLIALGNSSQDIADLLFISKHTVNNHRKNIMNKLDVNCVSKLIHFAVSFDLV